MIVHKVVWSGAVDPPLAAAVLYSQVEGQGRAGQGSHFRCQTKPKPGPLAL